MKTKLINQSNCRPVITEPGNSALLKTGTWRTLEPVLNKEHCINCLLCWLYCPDMSVIVRDGKVEGFDMDYCKGCGICALECHGKKGEKAILMRKEEKE
ncbi:MAG: ferredoxin [Smithellaceae bacterium]|nr:ferredoxin [Smithellaceae bacterium]